MPNAPPYQGWRRSHSTVSAPSARSCSSGSNRPSDPSVPRQLWMTTWKPRAATTRPSSRIGPPRPYGVRISTVGASGRSGA